MVTPSDIVLDGYKCIPGLSMNLFAVIKTLDAEWDIGNEGINIYLVEVGLTYFFIEFLTWQLEACVVLRFYHAL